VAWEKKIIQLSVCPINGMLVTITHNACGFVQAILSLGFALS